MLTWPAKDPDEVLDYQIDWITNRLEAAETISTSTWSVIDGDVAIQSSSHASGIATVWLTGGTDSTVCVIRNRITTSGGRTYDEAAKLRIRTKERV